MPCNDCKQDIPAYVGGIANGFVKPTPARAPGGPQSREERASIEFTQGPLGMTATAVECIVCAACYLVEFARVNPGAALPRMPQPVEEPAPVVAPPLPPSEQPEVRILGRFQPSMLDEAVIQAEIRPLLPACCQRERISVRVPMGVVVHPDNLQWHQDGGGPAGTTDHMVVWASEQPTELRTSAGVVVPTSAGDLIWFNNRKAFHRQPEGTNESKRWFVSVRCSG